MANNPIYADENFVNLANKGDSSKYDDQGNGNADDFIEAPLTENTNSGIPIESKLPKPIKDTASKKKNEVPGEKPADKKNGPAGIIIPLKPTDKKDIKPGTAPVLKPVDKNKKPVKNEKPKAANDY
jgi:hypothetical protein